MSDAAMIKIAADMLSERARLKRGGECVRYAAIVIQALEDAGYRVVKQEQIGRGGMEDANTAALSGGDVLWSPSHTAGIVRAWLNSVGITEEALAHIARCGALLTSDEHRLHDWTQAIREVQP